MSVKSNRLGPGSLKFGATGDEVEFAVGVRECTVEPETEEGDEMYVLSGDSISEGDEDSYVLTGSILQSYDVDSFILWAHTNHGTDVPFKFTPDNDKDFSVTGTVRVRRVAIGGEVKERNTSDFEFKGIGDYDLVGATGTELVFAAGTPGTPIEDDSPGWD